MTQREIKFRALYEGIWYYQKLEEILTITLAAFRLGKHKTQFTGLKDKKVGEIYEGDIVKGVWFKEGMSGFSGFIEYNIENSAFIVRKINGDERDTNWCYIPECQIEKIIGNIYEHPELLTTKK